MCQSCKVNRKLWMWQPWGPSPDSLCFSIPGSHYRGFPAFSLCDSCKGMVESGAYITLIYKKTLYGWDGASLEIQNLNDSPDNK